MERRSPRNRNEKLGLGNQGEGVQMTSCQGIRSPQSRGKGICGGRHDLKLELAVTLSGPPPVPALNKTMAIRTALIMPLIMGTNNGERPHSISMRSCSNR